MSRNKLVLSHVGYAEKKYYHTRAFLTSAKRPLSHPPVAAHERSLALT